MPDHDHDHEQSEAIVDRHLAQLSEHFDTVRVFVTRKVRGETGPLTAGYTNGGGCLYAQLGQVREWLTGQDHRVRLNTEERVRREREGE